jgi:DNA-binding transcriptional regulator YiaG
MKRKVSSITYKGFGFPIRLINVPMRKAYGDWVLEVNFAQLQVAVLLLLVKQTTPLSGREITCIRHFLDMSTTQFGELLGVSHVAVIKWENEERNMNPSTEIFLRLHVLDKLHVNDKEFRKIYLTFKPKIISKRKSKTAPLKIDVEAEKIAC